MELWIRENEAFDQEIAQRFGSAPALAAPGRLASWRAEPSCAIALVLVLDRFPRNLYRGSRRVFDHALHPVPASFLYLALEHAKNIGQQERAVRLFERLTAT